jgi:phenylalanyl-tRNA synthetase alpha chain
MTDSLERLRGEVLERIQQSESIKELEQLRIEALGRSGSITLLLRGLKELPADERPRMGERLNQLRRALEQELDARLAVVNRQARTKAFAEEKIDISLPGTRLERGHSHPLTLVIDEIVEIFSAMGFEIARGPDIEDDYHNFEALNIPKDHPARDMQDTFFVAGGGLLRTHTSPVQIRTMEKMKPPIRIVIPGVVHRNDPPDASHSPMFHQIEGLAVDTNITFCDLKGTLDHAMKALFGSSVKTSFRPSFFPFTEPSAEMLVSCFICGGSGKRNSEPCRPCKQTGWIEILGCGMVDPNVYAFVDYDPRKVSGFAFGMGADRIAILKYGVDDIQLFFNGDVRFLEQFG